MKTAEFRQQCTVNTTPSVVYETLMNARSHTALTGGPASISKKVGGAFTVFGEYAEGVNLELVPGKRILQTWRALEDGWPEDHYSVVTFDLQPVGRTGCRITLFHKNVPADLAESFKQGWKEYYWEPLRKKFNT